MRLGGLALIGELINPSRARARRAWESRNLAKLGLTAYQELAALQRERGADWVSVNLGGAPGSPAPLEEVLDFLPRLVPALQEAVDLPLAFDSPHLEVQRRALAAYRPGLARGEPAIVNSLAWSRPRLEEWLALVKEHDARAVALAAEVPAPEGRARPWRTAEECAAAARDLFRLLVREAGRKSEQVLLDPGLPPLLPRTARRVGMTLEALRLLRQDTSTAGARLLVAISNLSCRLPPQERAPLESAYLTLARQAGLDTVLADPDKPHRLLDEGDPALAALRRALEA